VIQASASSEPAARPTFQERMDAEQVEAPNSPVRPKTYASVLAPAEGPFGPQAPKSRAAGRDNVDLPRPAAPRPFSPVPNVVDGVLTLKRGSKLISGTAQAWLPELNRQHITRIVVDERLSLDLVGAREIVSLICAIKSLRVCILTNVKGV
jgi:hypothetical protein